MLPSGTPGFGITSKTKTVGSQNDERFVLLATATGKGIEKVGAAVSVLAKVTDKTPEKAPDADLFYATVEGNLSVDNPSQRKLDLRVAEAPAKPQVQVIENTPAPVNRVAQAAG